MSPTPSATRTAPSASAGVAERIKLLLRRDLKLGPDTVISDEMPLFGGDIDLDSLDVLLLLTSIEKEFGVKIPSEAVGKTVFGSVASLVAYLQAGAAEASPGASPAAGSTRPADPLARLPHAEPFRFVSRLVELQPGQHARGIWSVSGAEAFFTGHFPGNPIVPGVLIGEALAQLSGLVGASADDAAGSSQPPRGQAGKLAQLDVRFDESVIPPADIELNSRLMRSIGALEQFDVSATVASKSVARGSITLHCGAASDQSPAAAYHDPSKH